MEILIYFFIFLFGLAVGSFLNCVIYRLERGESFFSGRSYCPHCQHVLNWQDLIPVFSFLILKGKCRYCSQKISWQYPLVELATALLFISLLNLTQVRPVYNLTQVGPVYFCLLLISCFLVIIFVYDLRHYIIPDKVVYPAIGIAFLYQLFGTFEFRVSNLFRVSSFEFRIFEPMLNPLFSAILASIFFLLIVLVSKGKWMGVGDIKLAFLMGLILGWPNILVALFLAFSIGAIIGIGLIILGKKTLKSEVPFGPFLVTGTFIALFFGNQIINWYFNLF